MSEEKERSIFSENLNRYLRQSGKSQTEIAEHLEVGLSTFNSWRLGTRMPRMAKIQLLADYFGIKKSDLLEDCSALPADAIPYTPAPIVPIPLVGSVNCGMPLFAEDNIDGYIETPVTDIISGETYFWLRAKGNSMINLGIHEGDLLLIRKQADVDSGDIAVVAINGDDATLKRVIKKENALVLQPENPAYETKIFVGKEMEDVKIRGRLMEVKKKF